MLFTQNPAALLYMLPILVVTLTVHELCHGLAAYGLGDTTAKEQGRLSLNPLRHIDPIGFAMLLIMGFGWAKPVGVDLRNLKKPKRDFALVAAAGPFANFTLAFLFALVALSLGYAYRLNELTWDVLRYAILINVGLGVFNMFPIPPLDGSRLLAAFLPDKLYERYLRIGRYGMIAVMLLIASERIFGFSILTGAISVIFSGIIELADVPVRLLFQLFR